MCYSEDSWPKDGQRFIFEHHWGNEICDWFDDGHGVWGYELVDVELEPGFEFVEDDELTALLLELRPSQWEDAGFYKLQEFNYFVTREGRDLWKELGFEETPD